MTLKKCTPIDTDENGSLLLDIDCDAMNANWVRSAKLEKAAREGDEEARKKLEEMQNTALYEFTEKDREGEWQGEND